jgi:hypothetical protein
MIIIRAKGRGSVTTTDLLQILDDQNIKLERKNVENNFYNRSISQIRKKIKAAVYAHPEFTAPDAYGVPQATAEAILKLVDTEPPSQTDPW